MEATWVVRSHRMVRPSSTHQNCQTGETEYHSLTSRVRGWVFYTGSELRTHAFRTLEAVPRKPD